MKPEPLRAVGISGHRHLPGLVVLAASDPRDGGMNEGLVLEEAQMFPAAPPRVKDRLVRSAA